MKDPRRTKSYKGHRPFGYGGSFGFNKAQPGFRVWFLKKKKKKEKKKRKEAELPDQELATGNNECASGAECGILSSLC